MAMVTQAAQMLIGKTLNDGWLVTKKITNDNFAIDKGGVYSCCYEVENGNRKGFLKAFDYSAAGKIGVNNPEEEIQNLLKAFTVERDILQKCRDSKLKNVIELIDHGAYNVEEAIAYPRVIYLILEYAEHGDLRTALEEKRLTMEWKLRSLHQLAKGLKQIHNLSIAHQDIKPSNIVLSNNGTKISDFGSATAVNSPNHELPQHLKKAICGTWAYAPPELLYGEIYNDNIVRRIGCDLYLLGSMISFYFSDMTMTALIKSKLADKISWTNLETQGHYKELLTLIELAYEDALQELALSINEDKIRNTVVTIVRYLCHPNPAKRGHKKTIEQAEPNYDLQRFITMLSRLVTFYRYK
jgi:eukaryotic-like serine/threonine-protein kinase